MMVMMNASILDDATATPSTVGSDVVVDDDQYQYDDDNTYGDDDHHADYYHSSYHGDGGGGGSGSGHADGGGDGSVVNFSSTEKEQMTAAAAMIAASYSDGGSSSATPAMAAAGTPPYAGGGTDRGSSNRRLSRLQPQQQQTNQHHDNDNGITDDNRNSNTSSKSTSTKTIWHPLQPDASFRHRQSDAGAAGAAADLASLQTETLPAIPDEQDRKRFIGCLAAILSSSYDYDVDYYDDDNDKNGNDNNGRGKNSGGGAGGGDGRTTVDGRVVSNQSHYIDNDFYDDYFHSDDDDDDENDDFYGVDDDDDNSHEEKKKEHVMMRAPSTTTSDDGSRTSMYSRGSESFESFGTSKGRSSSLSKTAGKNSRRSTTTRKAVNQCSDSTTTTTTTSSSTSRRQSSSHHHQPLRRSGTSISSNVSSSNNNNRSRNLDRAQLSRERHRSRRYDVMSRLLMSAGEKLLLEKSVSRAFLPMLSPVLVPQLKRRRRDGGQGVVAHDGGRSDSRPPRPSSDWNHSSLSNMPSGSSAPALSSPLPSRVRSAPSSPTQFNNNQDESSVSTTGKTNASFSAMGGSDYASVMDSSYFSVDRTRRRQKNASQHNRMSNGVDYHSQAKNDPTSRQHNSDVDPSLPVQLPLIDNEEDIRPFLDSLTPGAGFRCVSLLLLQHLLTSEVGYDARVRHVLKKLSVIVLMHDMEHDPVEFDVSTTTADRRGELSSYSETFRRATRKFEAMEQSIAKRLIRLSAPARGRKTAGAAQRVSSGKSKSNNEGAGITKEQILRGVKIDGAGIVAGTLFALTGGLAAPGIAAGVAAVAGAAASTAAVTTLTSAAVVTTIFGVGGGGLAAYKMQRRTQGLTEFEFHKETGDNVVVDGDSNTRRADGNAVGENAALFSVLCISGWLRDNCDYQRPWGLQPTNPKIRDRQELLERFYSIYSPDHVPKCSKILNSWKGEEGRLWQVLKQKYGRDPDHLFPLFDQPRPPGNLTLEQEEVLDRLFVELGYNSVAPEKPTDHETHPSPFEKMKSSWLNRKARHADQHSSGLPPRFQRYDSTHGPSESLVKHHSSTFDSYDGNSSFSMDDNAQSKPEQQQDEEDYRPPKHIDTVWDYKMTYGGELYTIKWESELLQRICDCVMDLAFDVVSGATKHFLKQTVLATFMSAIMLPSYLLNVANMIDGDWTLAVERADEAGKVLAKTLLFSRAGRRPVTLVGYSFGARVIYSCLKELARFQEDWETYQDMLEEIETGVCSDEARYNRYHKKLKGIREPASIVEDAVLMGLPNHLSLPSWRACRQVVAGRLVNCYSTKDLILSLMFQAKRFSGGSLNAGVGSILKPVCGTCSVELNGIENVDASDLILGHQDYTLETGKILKRINFGLPFRCDCNTDSNLDSDIVVDDTAKKLTY